MAPNPLTHRTTCSSWNVVCWPLVVIKATRWFASQTWKVKKENLWTPKAGAAMVLDSGKSWRFKCQSSGATVLCCGQIKVQHLSLYRFSLVSFHPAKTTEVNKEVEQQLLCHVCFHLGRFLYSSCLHGSSLVPLTWPCVPRERLWCPLAPGSEGMPAGTGAQSHWGRKSRGKPCPSQSYRESAPGKCRVRLISSIWDLCLWCEPTFRSRSKVKLSQRQRADSLGKAKPPDLDSAGGDALLCLLSLMVLLTTHCPESQRAVQDCIKFILWE